MGFVESSGSKKFSMASKITFKASGGFYNIRATQRTLNQGHSMRRTKNTQWKRSPSHVQGFYRFFKISEELYFPHYTEGVESSGSKKFSMASKKMFKVSGGFYNIRALQRTLNQGHSMRRTKNTQWKRSPSHVQWFYRFSYFFKFLKNFRIFHHVEGVESSGSKKFSMASKIMFKVSGGFYNIKALQRTLNQHHRSRRKKDTQGKLIFFQILPPTGPLERFWPRLLYFQKCWKLQTKDEKKNIS